MSVHHKLVHEVFHCKSFVAIAFSLFGWTKNKQKTKRNKLFASTSTCKSIKIWKKPRPSKVDENSREKQQTHRKYIRRTISMHGCIWLRMSLMNSNTYDTLKKYTIAIIIIMVITVHNVVKRSQKLECETFICGCAMFAIYMYFPVFV